MRFLQKFPSKTSILHFALTFKQIIMRPDQIGIDHDDICVFRLAILEGYTSCFSWFVVEHWSYGGRIVEFGIVRFCDFDEGIWDWMKPAFGVPLSRQIGFVIWSGVLTIPSHVSVHCSSLDDQLDPRSECHWTDVYVPGESKGELPKYLHSLAESHQPLEETYMLPKLNARLILSVMKYLEHLPYRLSRTCRLKKFFRKAGWSNENKVGNALLSTREYEREACNAPSLFCQTSLSHRPNI